MEILFQLNWIAVAVGTIIYCAFCGIWHRPFTFGKKWEDAMGFQRPESWKETNIYYVIALIACFVTTVAIAVLLTLTNTNTFSGAVKLGLILGVGFAMAVVFTTAVIPTMKKPLTFGMITGTAQALGILIVTVVVNSISN